MTELEHRALIGDRQAQKEATRKWIVLPCPHCGGKAEIFSTEMEAPYNHTEYQVMCKTCFASTWWDKFKSAALDEWNTRPAPPIGRCKDCANWYKQRCASGPCATEPTGTDFFCGNFEPKPQWKELAVLQLLDGAGAEEGAGKNHVPGYPPQKVYCAGCKNPNNPEKCLLAGQEKPISTFCSGFEPKENANG